MFRKWIVLAVVILVCQSLPTQALETSFFVGGGPTSFPFADEVGYHFKTGVKVMSDTGLGFDFTTGYYNSGYYTAESMVPIGVGISYTMVPRQLVSPYIGTGLEVNFFPDTHHDPLLGFRIAGGIQFRLSSRTNMFFELEKKFIPDDGFDPNPYSFTIGYQIKLSRSRRTYRPPRDYPPRRAPHREKWDY